MAQYCRVCGKKLAHFLNPDRWICPNESNHKNTAEMKSRSKTMRENPAMNRKGTHLTEAQRKRMSAFTLKRIRDRKKRDSGNS